MGAEIIQETLPHVDHSPLRLATKFAIGTTATGLVFVGVVAVGSSLQEFGQNVDIYTRNTAAGPNIFLVDTDLGISVDMAKRDSRDSTNSINLFRATQIYADRVGDQYSVRTFSLIDLMQRGNPIRTLLESDEYLTPVISESGYLISFYPTNGESFFFTLDITTGEWNKIELQG